MKRLVGAILRKESGLTLLELTVVSAVMALMAALVALAVTGRTTQTQATAKVADIAQVDRAVLSYSGEHPQGHYPTLNGCLAGKVLDLITRKCVSSSQVTSASQLNTSNLEFTVAESSLGVDLNEDGDLADSFAVVPIIWGKAFAADRADNSISRFVPDQLARSPKHAHDFLGGSDESWKDGTNTDLNGLGDVSGNPSLITAPQGIGVGQNMINASSLQVPVWALGVINGAVRVVNLLPDSRY